MISTSPNEDESKKKIPHLKNKLKSSKSEHNLISLSYSGQTQRVKDYELYKEIGRGAYGKVFLGKKFDEETKVAIKVLDKFFLSKNEKTHEAMIERSVLTMCNHPSIIKLLSTFQTKNKLFYVLEFCQNKDLDFLSKKFGIISDNIARVFAAEIINVLDYLHNTLNFSHRDLKPSNIMLDSNFHIKLIDFSTAKKDGYKFDMHQKTFVLSNVIDKEIVGTAEYCSPEMLNQNVLHSPSVDVWAFGCMLYLFYHGRSPFKADTDARTFLNIKSGKTIISELIPKDAKDLIEKSLCVDQTKRITVKEIKHHDYFKNINFETLLEEEVPIKKDIFDKFKIKLTNGDSNTGFWNNFCNEVNGRNLVEFVVENFSVFTIIDDYVEKPKMEITFSSNSMNLIYEGMVIRKHLLQDTYYYLKLYSNKKLKCSNPNDPNDLFSFKISQSTTVQYQGNTILIREGKNKFVFSSTTSELLKWYSLLTSLQNIDDVI